jgi:bifunctional DNA-binding transcriptional regulator/antitoxin component of YhaV-PrlF toxin-antitoxin module
MTATLTAQGEIAIPREFLDSAGIKPGDQIELELDNHEIVMRRLRKRTVDLAGMRSALGCAKDAMPGITAAQWLDETRGPVELPPAS